MFNCKDRKLIAKILLNSKNDQWTLWQPETKSEFTFNASLVDVSHDSLIFKLASIKHIPKLEKFTEVFVKNKSATIVFKRSGFQFKTISEISIPFPNKVLLKEKRSSLRVKNNLKDYEFVILKFDSREESRSFILNDKCRYGFSFLATREEILNICEGDWLLVESSSSLMEGAAKIIHITSQERVSREDQGTSTDIFIVGCNFVGIFEGV